MTEAPAPVELPGYAGPATRRSFRRIKLGLFLSNIEDWTRYLLIPTLLFLSISSLLGNGPF